jgi:hypothetical protein
MGASRHVRPASCPLFHALEVRRLFDLTFTALLDSPDPAPAASQILLQAVGIPLTEQNGLITTSFYRESNATPGLQRTDPADTFLRAVTGTDYNFSATIDIPANRTGLSTYYARATLGNDQVGNIVSTTNTSYVNPTAVTLSVGRSNTPLGSHIFALPANVPTPSFSQIITTSIYRESNSTPGLQLTDPADQFLASSNQVNVPVPISTLGLDTGLHTLYGRTHDNFGAVSNIATTTVTLTTSPLDPAFSGPPSALAPARNELASASNPSGLTALVNTPNEAPDEDADLKLTIFDTTGNTLAATIDVITDTLGKDTLPSVAVAPNGTIFVAWRRFTSAAFYTYGRFFSPSGTPVTDPISITPTGADTRPAVTAFADNTFALATAIRDNTSTTFIHHQRLDSTGTALAPLARVTAATTGEIDPAITSSPNRYLVTFTSGASVLGRIFNLDGSSASATLTLATSTSGVSRITASPDGQFFLSWRRSSGTGFDARGFYAFGLPRTPIFSLDTALTTNENTHSTTLLSNGNLLATIDNGGAYTTVRQFNLAGQPVGSELIAIPRGQFSSVAATPTGFTVFANNNLQQTIIQRYTQPSQFVSLRLHPATDTGPSNTDAYTSVSQPTFQLTLTSPGTLTLDLNNDSLPDLTQTIDTPGPYNILAPAPLAAGQSIVTATLTPTGQPPSTSTLLVQIDTSAPTLTGTLSRTFVTNESAGRTATYTALTAADNTGLLPVTYSHPSGSFFAFGTTDVVVTATDGAGNTTTRIIKINIIDPPFIVRNSSDVVYSFTSPALTVSGGSINLLPTSLPSGTNFRLALQEAAQVNLTTHLQFVSLTISPTASLRTGSHSLISHYSTTSLMSTLTEYVRNSRITPSPDLLGLPTNLAISEAADLGLTEFNGTPIDDTTTLLKYTYVGDANLDGQVDALDYERVDLSIGNSGVLGTAQGDLNYDGVVDALDYEQVDLNVGNGVGTPLAPLSIANSQPVAQLIYGPATAALRHPHQLFSDTRIDLLA